MKSEPVMAIISFSSMMDFAVTDKNSLFGGPSIGKMELCVKGESSDWGQPLTGQTAQG